MTRNIVLLGGGHAHLHVIAQAAEFRRSSAALTLVDPGNLWYSGMATGMLGGRYTPEDDQIPLAELCARHGVACRQVRAVDVDTAGRSIGLSDGGRLSYDLLSLNVGSTAAVDGIDDPEGIAWTVKPIPKLRALRQKLEEYFRRDAPCRVVVVGGGPTGCEVAANIASLFQRAGQCAEITLLHGGSRLIEAYPAAAGETLRKALGKRGIAVRTGARAHTIRRDAAGQGRVDTDGGAGLEFDEIVLATGLAPAAIRDLGLGDDGLAVAPTLAARDHASVFGAGDCIDFLARPLPRVGVFGVRQAPVLARNLRAALAGASLEDYRPQTRFLSILNLGDGTGLALRGDWHWHGRSSFIVKHFIDRRFMRRYRQG